MSAPFAYAAPETVSGALELLARAPGARIVAGGTDLLVAVRREREAPALVVDVTRIPELSTLRQEDDGTLRVGAALSHARVARSELVGRLAPVLAHASASVGSVPVRNLATLGGNCANASVAGDTLPALAALRARFEIAGAGGTRRLSVDEFFVGPGRTALRPEEMLTAVLIPLQPRHGAAFLKVGRRRAAAISRLSVAVMANADTGLARIALGAVFPKPQRVPAAEEVLSRGFGDPLLRDAGIAAAEAVKAASGGRASMAYKLPVIRTAVHDALRRALTAGGQGEGHP